MKILECLDTNTMTYFTLSASRDEKEIGFYPQTTLAKDYNPTLDNSHRKVF